ncbi:unnamed protein product [Lactuca saligna]|uniref:Uncharacterized protein n=1 Tax=Lactuca saligna TaxID=75948 RepID=A0AA35V0T6_LACSI|nr:unnamed protein product [Lactuca saligna]
MAKPGDRMDDDKEASKSNNQLVTPVKEEDYDCQTPTSKDHKIQSPRFHLPPPPPCKRRRRSTEDGKGEVIVYDQRTMEEGFAAINEVLSFIDQGVFSWFTGRRSSIRENEGEAMKV